MLKNFHHIAIVRLSALGDIVNSSIVLQFIKQRYPDIKIDWICEEAFAPVLNTLEEIHQVHTINLKELKKKRSFSLLRKNIKKLKMLPTYDLIIDMQGLLKSALVSRLICKRVHGFDKNSIREAIATTFYSSTTSIAYEENIILRNVALINDALDLSITKEMIENKKASFYLSDTLTCKEKTVALVIGASWPSKIFPIEKHMEICQQIDANFVVIWGSPSEKEEAIKIVSTCNNATLSEKMNLSELVHYLSHVDLVIGNDTGPTHMAWAQNIASITLFGPTNTRMIYETSKNIAIESPSPVNILKINKNDFSIYDIDVNHVIIEAKKLLDI